MLANTIGFMPVGVHLAIVDPGRRWAAAAARAARRRGPYLRRARTTGCLLPAASRAGIDAAHELANPEYALESISRTFHGRDLFAPPPRTSRAACRSRELGPPVDPEGLVRLDIPEPAIADGAIRATLLYVDSFGNIALNLDRDDVEALGIVSGTRVELELAGERYYAVMAQDVRGRATRRRDPLRGQLQEHVARDLPRKRGAHAARVARAADPDHDRGLSR